MEKEVISLEQLSTENVLKLSEEDVSNLLNKIISDLPKERRSNYVSILNSAFEFRSISAKSRTLKGDLSLYGFKFFSIPYNNRLIMGVKRKRQ
jgi:hypothetical protein